MWRLESDFNVYMEIHKVKNSQYNFKEEKDEATCTTRYIN